MDLLVKLMGLLPKFNDFEKSMDLLAKFNRCPLNIHGFPCPKQLISIKFQWISTKVKGFPSKLMDLLATFQKFPLDFKGFPTNQWTPLRIRRYLKGLVDTYLPYLVIKMAS